MAIFIPVKMPMTRNVADTAVFDDMPQFPLPLALFQQSILDLPERLRKNGLEQLMRRPPEDLFQAPSI